ncbi:MAG: hypothetical protein A3A82_03975 [Candidatus Pacebacteria bacterium RIFCSPLOWO2_01_FULL_47_12]|nr:MAG: hypothetical protein A3A82_03975 [Candidatus Pacebacteria bacterium RIFCSPLOWO2_01_FULL_47_12]
MLRLLTFLVCLYVSVPIVFAATLQVTKIGGVTTSQSFSYWTHQGTNPTFVGTAATSSTVQLTLGSVTGTASAGLDGMWSYTPTTLFSGEYPITVSSGQESKSFTLLIASGSATKSGTSSSQSASTQLPVSGGLTTTLTLLLLGCGSIITALLWQFGVLSHLCAPEDEE